MTAGRLTRNADDYQRPREPKAESAADDPLQSGRVDGERGEAGPTEADIGDCGCRNGSRTALSRTRPVRLCPAMACPMPGRITETVAAMSPRPKALSTSRPTGCLSLLVGPAPAAVGTVGRAYHRSDSRSGRAGPAARPPLPADIVVGAAQPVTYASVSPSRPPATRLPLL
jgi:hypothetical protein